MDKNVSVQKLQAILQKSVQIINKYDWLINAYILDFYVDDHWAKLPDAWRELLEALPTERLHQLLDYNVAFTEKVFPLELMALRQLLRDLCISRQRAMKDEHTMLHSTLLSHPKLKHIFKKCVKPKKLHEIQYMAAICKRSCLQIPVDFVVDFGAGLGHLARILGYGFGIRVCCLEMQQAFNEQASIIDLQLESVAKKHLSVQETASFQRPTHVTLKLTTEMQPHEFVATISAALQLSDSNFRFGIIGLHPCGDLAAILMRMFLSCVQAKFLNFVSCCYMKLSTSETSSNTSKLGYPLSAHMQQMGQRSALRYESREISCHAAEVYCDRLAMGDYEHLKVHSFRAATERILIKHWPELRHCGLRNVKHVPGMQFEDYFYKAVQGLEAIHLPAVALRTAPTATDLRHWKRIVIFYTLRLMFAPLVESVILYDRALFLREQQCHVEISAIFDPRLSPRNHITSATKRS